MLDFIVPDWPAPPQVRALSTTRRGGTSSAPYAGLNLGDHVGDDPVCVAANRALLRAQLPAEPLWLRQVHGTVAVDAASAAVGSEADAAYACRERVVCAVMTADCLPVLFCDRRGTVVAAAHAGWRGLAAGVLERTVSAMAAEPATLLAWLGPAIGAGAFEVGDEVRAAFVDVDPEAACAFRAGLPGKWLADIYALARRRLAAVGVSAVFGGDRCTHDERECFFSHRRDRVSGRMATVIWRE